MDFRKVFDSIPDKFDEWRPRYCNETFDDMIRYSKLNADKRVLEIGPGTGQATEPVLKTGCSYSAIELGEHFTEYTKKKFCSYDNFHIVNADFETYDFEPGKFDLVYSAATIQWIPEKIAFPKVYSILKDGGTFAMMMTHTDEKSQNEKLHSEIQNVYNDYFHPQEKYSCRLEYTNVVNYGFKDFECRKYYKIREFNAEEYASYTGTHCEHITLQEPYKTKFYDGIKKAVKNAGDKILLKDTIELYLVRK